MLKRVCVCVCVCVCGEFVVWVVLLGAKQWSSLGAEKSLIIQQHSNQTRDWTLKTVVTPSTKTRTKKYLLTTIYFHDENKVDLAAWPVALPLKRIYIHNVLFRSVILSDVTCSEKKQIYGLNSSTIHTNAATKQLGQTENVQASTLAFMKK